MDFMSYLYIIPIALISIVLHEMGHAYMSFAFGDPTPKEDGRLTPNPLKHIDPIGIAFLILFRVGWARPVRINPQYYRHPRLAIFLVSFAGPLINIILAFLGGLIVRLSYYSTDEVVFTIISNIGLYFLILNVSLALFNLIPIPPLDGSRLIAAILPDSARESYLKYERYGFFIIMGIVLLINILYYFTGRNLFNDVILYFVRLILSIFGIAF